MVWIVKVLGIADDEGNPIGKYRLTARSDEIASDQLYGTPYGLCEHEHDTIEEAGNCPDARREADIITGIPLSSEFAFEAALRLLKQGKRVCRSGWNGKGMWIELQRPDYHSKMTLPYLYIRAIGGDLVPWLPSQTDLLSEDWTTAD
jgi:hypothetical protein